MELFGLVDPAKATLIEQNKYSDIVNIVISSLKPQSRGRITLNSRSIFDPPRREVASEITENASLPKIRWYIDTTAVV